MSVHPARRRCLKALVAGAVLPLAACGGRDPAPSIRFTKLDGSAGSTEALRGRVVFVNFWATSCTTCVAEMPEIAATHRAFAPRGYETLAVAMQYDPPAFVSNFAQSRALPFPVVIDNTGAIAKAFGDVQLTPTSFLLDKQGRIVKRYVGAPDFAALRALVERLLAEA
jgi:peroxiredoxin